MNENFTQRKEWQHSWWQILVSFFFMCKRFTYLIKQVQYQLYASHSYEMIAIWQVRSMRPNTLNLSWSQPWCKTILSSLYCTLSTNDSCHVSQAEVNWTLGAWSHWDHSWYLNTNINPSQFQKGDIARRFKVSENDEVTCLVMFHWKGRWQSLNIEQEVFE